MNGVGMDKRTVWQKFSRLALVSSVFLLLACTQSQVAPTQAAHENPPMHMPAQASKARMEQAKVELSARKWSHEDVQGYSFEQMSELLAEILESHSTIQTGFESAFKLSLEGQAYSAPDFSKLDDVSSNNASQLAQVLLNYTSRYHDLQIQLDKVKWGTSDIENMHPWLLFGLISNYISEHPEQKKMMRDMQRLPSESDQAFSDREWTVFGDTAGHNLKLINRYMEYYAENGVRFGR